MYYLYYTYGGSLTGLYHCRHTNYYCAFRLCHVLFWNALCQATSGSRSLILLEVLVVFQQASCQSFHAFCPPLPCSILSPGTLSRASSGSGSLCPILLALADYLIVTSMNNHKSPTNATITANWIAHRGVYAYMVGWTMNWINSMDSTDIHQVFTVF